MSKATEPPVDPASSKGSDLKIWIGGGVFALIVLVLVIGKFSGWIDPIEIGTTAKAGLRDIAATPWGPVALIAFFVLSAFIAVPQFILIGVSVFAFGPIFGAILAWFATLVSGTFNYWLGRLLGSSVIDRLNGPRVRKFISFIGRNTFVASMIVRNAPAGPFLMVNMLFGSARASYLQFISGMGLGIVPKILFVTFGFQAVMAALSGNIVLSVAAAIVAFIVFGFGWLYVRQRQRRGEIISIDGD